MKCLWFGQFAEVYVFYVLQHKTKNITSSKWNIKLHDQKSNKKSLLLSSLNTQHPKNKKMKLQGISRCINNKRT